MAKEKAWYEKLADGASEVYSYFNPVGVAEHIVDWGKDLFGGDGPDTSGMNAAAVQNSKNAADQLEWMKRIYEESAPQRADAIARANAVSDAQLASMRQNDSIAKDYWDYQKNTYRPLEQGIVDAANNYDTEGRRNEAAQKAAAGVEMSLANVQQQQRQNLERRGINPASGAALALANQQGLEKAKLLAGAQNNARQGIELQGYARRMDAANMGRGLASNQATSAGLALNAGNAAAANGQIGGNVTAQGAQMMNSGYQGAQQGYNSAANIYGNIGALQNQFYNNQTNRFSAFMGAGEDAGKAYAALSDKNTKKNIKPVSGKKSLAALSDMRVSNWDYKKGEGDGGNHTGPMAQDVRSKLGEDTAPGGKVIDMISMAGHAVNAIGELNKRLSLLEHRIS